MASFKSVAYLAPRYVEVQQVAATIPATGYLFVCDDYYKAVQVKVRYSNVGSSGATLAFYKVPSGTAPGSGTAMCSTVDLTQTANVNYTGTLSTTAGALDLAPGDAVAVVFAGTLTNLAGLVGQIVLKPTRVSARTR